MNWGPECNRVQLPSWPHSSSQSPIHGLKCCCSGMTDNCIYQAFSQGKCIWTPTQKMCIYILATPLGMWLLVPRPGIVDPAFGVFTTGLPGESPTSVNERMRLISCAPRGCWCWSSWQHLLTSPPSISLHPCQQPCDYNTYFTDEEAEAQRGAGTTTQPVCGRARVRTQGCCDFED